MELKEFVKGIKTIREKIEKGEASPDFTGYKNARLLDTATDGQYVYYTFEHKIDSEIASSGKSKLI